MARALESIARSTNDAEYKRIAAALRRIPGLPGYDEDDRHVDESQELNRSIMRRWLLGVGLDEELAEALYALDLDPASWPVYPDAPEVVSAVKATGCLTALVSDFHVDLRPHLSAHGITLDAYVISFEHGFQKPDPRMFTTALDALGVSPHEALMVGDRASHDGGAAEIGIDTLILPAPGKFGPRGLDVILDLVGS